MLTLSVGVPTDPSSSCMAWSARRVRVMVKGTTMGGSGKLFLMGTTTDTEPSLFLEMLGVPQADGIEQVTTMVLMSTGPVKLKRATTPGRFKDTKSRRRVPNTIGSDAPTSPLTPGRVRTGLTAAKAPLKAPVSKAKLFACPKGVNGLNGLAIFNGLIGLTGFNGFNGLKKFAGLAGLNGLNTDESPNGLIGDVKPTGFNGFNGLKGFAKLKIGPNKLNGLNGFTACKALFASWA